MGNGYSITWWRVTILFYVVINGSIYAIKNVYGVVSTLLATTEYAFPIAFLQQSRVGKFFHYHRIISDMERNAIPLKTL